MGAVASRPDPSHAAPRRLLRLRGDVALADRFVAGDQGAFAVLYERYSASVLAVCMGVLGSRQDAEDAAQETFTSLAKSLPHTRPDNFGAWLTRVARNAAIDIARRRSSNAQAHPDLPDRAGNGDGMKAELESVVAGLKELPESQRTALLMRELAGHSYREIATLLDLEEEAVRGLIARARVSLRAHREASEMECATARAVLAAELDEPGRGDQAVRRHVRSCSPCRAYRRALRGDARDLRGIILAPGGSLATGGAIFGGLAAKGALLGSALTQATAACAVSVCAVGGIVLLTPGAIDHHRPHPVIAHRASARVTSHGAGSRSTELLGSSRGAEGPRGAAGQRGPGAGRSTRQPAQHGANPGAQRQGAQALALSLSTPAHNRGSQPGTGTSSGSEPRPSPQPAAHPAGNSSFQPAPTMTGNAPSTYNRPGSGAASPNPASGTHAGTYSGAPQDPSTSRPTNSPAQGNGQLGLLGSLLSGTSPHGS